VDDRIDDRAFGADDVAPLGPKFRKLRFQMIADSDIAVPALRARTFTPIHRRLVLARPRSPAVATRKEKARLESEKQAQRRAVAWQVDLQLGREFPVRVRRPIRPAFMNRPDCWRADRIDR
jgi:hypothetical protein